MGDNEFMIVEFNDGVHIIPAMWYNASDQSCIWPAHFKTKFRITKAIISKEVPRERSDWERLLIKRCFGRTSK